MAEKRYRKFGVTVVAIVSVTAVTALGYIDGDTYEKLIVLIAGGFIAGDVVDKRLNK